jgi:predicted alpha/beta superfamily hydrolase
MLNASSAFNEHLLYSPSIWLEPQLLDKASAFSSALPVRVFVGFGSKEDEQLAEGHMSKKRRSLWRDCAIMPSASK